MFKCRRTIIVSSILVSFIVSSIQMPAFASVSAVEETGNIAQIDPMPFMPKPGVMVPLSPEYTPAYLKGIVIHPENALKFDFIIYKGDKALTDAQKREEYTKLTKYFLASLAIPDSDQWVNLSPYEKDRIIKDDFGKTEMGRDLLAQDYLLKQITASLIYPEDNLGKKFWGRVYKQAQEQYGTTNIPVNTFNKVWILPDDALIYEKGNTAYVLKNHLRVMLEEDYLSLQKHTAIVRHSEESKSVLTHTIASKIIKEIVLPELQKEVNEDKNFAPLRQVYSGMLLATWFKRTLKQSLLAQIYVNKGKIRGVDHDPKTNEEIYRQYLQAYKKGVFNFIKEDTDRMTNETIPRKYFSGGAGSFTEAGELLPNVYKTTRNKNLGNPAMMADEDNDVVATVGLIEDRVIGTSPLQDRNAAMRRKDEAMIILTPFDYLPIVNNSYISVNGERFSLFEFSKVRGIFLALGRIAGSSKIEPALLKFFTVLQKSRSNNIPYIVWDLRKDILRLFEELPNSNDDLRINNPLILDELQMDGLVDRDSDILSARYRTLINLSLERRDIGQAGMSFHLKVPYVNVPDVGLVLIDKFIDVLAILEKLRISHYDLFKKLVEFAFFSGSMTKEEKGQLPEFFNPDGTLDDQIRKLIAFSVRVNFETKDKQKREERLDVFKITLNKARIRLF